MKVVKPKYQFKKEQVVTWTSHAKKTTQKKGRVVAVINKGNDPKERYFALIKKYGAKSTYGGGSPRDHKSYLVLVPSKVGQQPRLYWPKTVHLSPVTEQVD